MLYLLETQLPDKKPVRFALTKIYGINNATANTICKKLGFSLNLKIKDLTGEQIQEIFVLIESLNIMINNDLRTFKSQSLSNLVNIKAYRGLRRIRRLPVRGQRTHTNARSAKKGRS